MLHRLSRLTLATGAAVAVIAASAVTLGAVPAQAYTTSGNLFASVNLNGTLAYGSGVTGVTHIGTGRYEVSFSADVQQCAYVATTINAYSQALQVFTAGGPVSVFGGHLSSNGVYVETKNQGGGLTDGPFNLVVDCGLPGWSYAVIGYNANLVRSSPGVALTSLGTGRYDVTFHADISRCAYLATVGDPGNGLVFNPGGVYTGSGPNLGTVYVETKNQGGGLSAGIPFHLAVICPTAASVKVAVVAANGHVSRGSRHTRSFSLASGQYTLLTNRPLSACAAVATRGSIDTAAPFDPATVEIVRGGARNTVGLQVRQLLFSGGNPASESFHAAVVC
jgi:hypothetical protein